MNLRGSFCLLLLFVFFSAGTSAQTPDFKGTKSSWHEGFDRFDYIMDVNTLAISPFAPPEKEGFGLQDPPPGYRRCVVVAPKKPAAGNPWSWRGCYWDHQPQTEIELLRRGFYIAYISSSASLGPGKEWDAWYAFLTKQGLSPKPAFIGMSRGGFFEYSWATQHPDQVAAIYADNPLATPDILMKLGGLAQNGVPLFHVCGSLDPLYPGGTLAIENIYRQFGGEISVMIKEGFGHHPHSLHQPVPIADFIERACLGTKKPVPDFAEPDAPRFSFYSSAQGYRFFPEEGAYISFRGPFFNGSYARYTVLIKGVESFSTVLEPEIEAPGKPWVFRPDGVKGDDALDFALLKKGYHIVTGAVPYNGDGPAPDQWNLIYQFLTEKGFSPKPVMQGFGNAAGEALAWAILNPDRVSAFYAENPIFSSKVMLKGPLLNRLDPLAKAGVPIFLVSGSEDPALPENARAAEKAYRTLKGKFSLQIIPDAGHFLPLLDPSRALDVISP